MSASNALTEGTTLLPEFPSDREEKRRFLLDAVERVRDVIESHADEADDNGTLSRAAVDAIREAGLFALKLPEGLGGAEADPVTQIEVIEALSRVDSSAGWCLMIGATSIGQPAAFVGDEAIATIFENGHVPTAATVVMPAGKATPVDGGYVLNGRWPFASGVRHSEWICTGAFADENDGGPPTYLVLVYPTSSAVIHDNWQVSGLQGTGSNDISVSDLFVPKSFTWDFAKWEIRRGGPIYRMGRPGFVTNEHVAFALGAGRRALDEIMASSSAKRRGYPPSSVADRPSFQRDIGECDLKLRAARSLSLEIFENAWQITLEGNIPGPELQAEMRGVATYATDIAVDVVTTAFRYAGGSALYRPGILQRCHRDINAAAQHFMVSNSAYEHHGVGLLNLPDIKPMA